MLLLVDPSTKLIPCGSVMRKVIGAVNVAPDTLVAELAANAGSAEGAGAEWIAHCQIHAGPWPTARGRRQRAGR
ncbi:MAG: hypothetical protein IPH76_03665 [Xanthomonadales bacterium]|nr:hypothetical protein [Xanthomonadales bacterium]